MAVAVPLLMACAAPAGAFVGSRLVDVLDDALERADRRTGQAIQAGEGVARDGIRAATEVAHHGIEEAGHLGRLTLRAGIYSVDGVRRTVERCCLMMCITILLVTLLLARFRGDQQERAAEFVKLGVVFVVFFLVGIAGVWTLKPSPKQRKAWKLLQQQFAEPSPSPEEAWVNMEKHVVRTLETLGEPTDDVPRYLKAFGDSHRYRVFMTNQPHTLRAEDDDVNELIYKHRVEAGKWKIYTWPSTVECQVRAEGFGKMGRSTCTFRKIEDNFCYLFGSAILTTGGLEVAHELFQASSLLTPLFV